MALQSFIARNLPTIKAAWLNAIDRIVTQSIATVGVDSGAANAAVVTLSGTLTEFVRTTGTQVSFTPAATNTGAATLNVNGSGVAAIVNQAGNALTGGELSVPITVSWNGTAWRIVAGSIPVEMARTASETTAAVVPTNYIYPPLHAFRYMTSAQIADVVARTGLVDVRAALQNAISVAQINGGVLYCPPGSYLIRRIASPDSQFNGLHIPYTSVFGYTSHMILEGAGRETVFLAGDNSMIVIRLSDSRTTLTNFSIDANSKTGITGLGLLGSDTSSGALAEHVDWNIITGLDIVGCAEGTELESPSLGGCYWNHFEAIRFYNNTRHIRLRDNATSFGANRNSFIDCTITGGNTGIYLDGSDTCAIINCKMELVAVGVSPLATPTAIYIREVGSAGGLATADTYIAGCMLEDNTRDLECNNRRTTIIGGNVGATGNVLLNQVPECYVGGDAQYRLRNLLMGTLASDGLFMTSRATAYQACPQLATSANAAGSYPFNGDGHLIVQGRQNNGNDITFRTGAASTERVRMDGNGNVNLLTATLGLGSTAAQVIVNGSTIATALVRHVRVAPAGAVTGIILDAGTQPGQLLIISNEGGGTVTFAAFATSRVADGAASVIAVNKCMIFVWNTGTNAWYSDQ